MQSKLMRQKLEPTNQLQEAADDATLQLEVAKAAQQKQKAKRRTSLVDLIRVRRNSSTHNASLVPCTLGLYVRM